VSFAILLWPGLVLSSILGPASGRPAEIATLFYSEQGLRRRLAEGRVRATNAPSRQNDIAQTSRDVGGVHKKMPMFHKTQYAAVAAAIEKTSATTDFVSFTEVLAAAGVVGLQRNRFGEAAADLLGGTLVEDAATKIRRLQVPEGTDHPIGKRPRGMSIQGFRVKPGVHLTVEDEPAEPEAPARGPFQAPQPAPQTAPQAAPHPPTHVHGLSQTALRPGRDLEKDEIDQIDWETMTNTSETPENRIRQMDDLVREMNALMSDAQNGDANPAAQVQAYGGIAKLAGEVAACRRGILRGRKVFELQQSRIEALEKENAAYRGLFLRMGQSIAEIRAAGIKAGWLAVPPGPS
jgi:hypothetical protein